MKNERRYQALCEMLQAYDAATGNRGADHVIKNPNEWINNAWQPFYANAATLLIEALEGMDNAKSDRSALAAIKRICKGTENMQAGLRGIIPSVDADGRETFTICDGHRMVRLYQDPQSLPHVDAEKAFSSKEINRIMDVQKYGEKLNLPTIAEIKAFIAETKAKYGKDASRHPICIDNFIYVNPQYLLDMLQALPDCEAIRPTNKKHPIYFKSDAGDGILLPVNYVESNDNAA